MSIGPQGSRVSDSRPTGRGQGRLLAFDLTQPQDRLDAGDLALGLDDLAGRLEPLGLALEAEAEQVVLDFLEQQVELLVGLFAKFGWAWTSTSIPL